MESCPGKGGSEQKLFYDANMSKALPNNVSMCFFKRFLIIASIIFIMFSNCVWKVSNEVHLEKAKFYGITAHLIFTKQILPFTE